MAIDGVNVLAEFSPNGDYLACSDSSGTLQIWETSTATKSQQYIPSSHLSATCSCISWAPGKRSVADETPTKKKRRKSDVEKSVDDLELIALGTATGTVLLYSRTKNGLHTELTDGHIDRVTDVCWNQPESLLYSCSLDGQIVEWSLLKSCLKRKWKGDKAGVYSVCLCHTQRHLLSAGRSIKLWDLDTGKLLQMITGHQWPVIRVLHVPKKNQHHTRNSVADDESSIDGSYVVSADNTDRHISIWQLNTSAKQTIRKTIASLTLPDDSARQLALSSSQQSKVQIAVLTGRGKVAIFEHVFNGPSGPLKPEHVVEMHTGSEDGVQLPVRAIKFTSVDSMSVAYSSDRFLQPAFDTLRPEHVNGERRTRLIRKIPRPAALSVEASLSKLKTPLISDDVTVVRPAAMAPSVPVRSADEPGQEKKRRRRRSLEITVEERLHAIGVVEPSMGGGGDAGDQLQSKDPPKTDSLATVLSQGLLSNDVNMITSVLQRRDATIIEQTVRRLPLPAVVPLLKELSKRMGGHAQGALVTRLWLKHVVTTHASYLMTLPDRDNILGPIHQVMESRLDTLKKVCQLQGRLNLIYAQLQSKDAKAELLKMDRAQLVYRDDSSDEEFGIDDDSDLMSEDEWEPQGNDDQDMESDDDDELKNEETDDSDEEGEVDNNVQNDYDSNRVDMDKKDTVNHGAIDTDNNS